MVDAFILGAYWGSRSEPLNQVAHKIAKTLEKLSAIDMHFSEWYELGMSRKHAVEKKVSLDVSSIEQICMKKVRKGEFDNKGFSTNGFSLGLWTGHKDEESSSISLSVGAAFHTDLLSNRCVIKVPFEGESRRRILQSSKAKKLLTTLVEVWNPDYAVLTSDKIRNEVDNKNQIGWITYRRSIERRGEISENITYENFLGGHLYQLKYDNYEDGGSCHELASLKEVIG